MSDKADTWKEKYLKALEEQEHLERGAHESQELLRRALVRVSLVAEGLDKDLDVKLKGLRHVLRPQADKAASLAEGHMQELEEGILAFEAERKRSSKKAQESLKELSEQLKALDLPKDLRSGLKRFQKGLKQRLEKVQEYPAVLHELSSLQAHAFEVLEDQGSEKPGFLKRLLGAKDAAIDDSHDSSDPDSPNENHFEEVRENAEPIEQSSNSELDHDTSPGLDETAEKDQTGVVIEGELSEDEPQTEAVFQRPLHEPAFSKISAKVTRVLTELLDQVEASPCVVQKVENAKLRIDRGLNWFELVPTLEDIRDLVMQAYLEADNDHMVYLEGVNAELASIYELLGGAVEAENAERQAGEALNQELETSVEVLSKGLALTEDIDELRTQVSGQIDQIKVALQTYQVHRDARPEPLSEQLQVLVEKVQAMESEAQQSKEDYEEQRKLAMEDTLTSLPNRQAYNERIYHEQQRWERYQHPLTLAVADIDFFKKVNDTYGHQAGDRVLRVIGRAISKRLREVDFMARYGGEEFVLIMPETSAEAAFGILDKIRGVLAETPFHFKEAPVQITLSIGMAEFQEGDTAESVFERADKALYEAKDGGRNQCRKL